MQYRLLSAKSGKSVEVIKQIHKDALNEVTILGISKEDSNEFCKVFIEEELNLDDTKKVSKNLNDAYLKSKQVSFNLFIEDLINEDESGVTVSTDFSPSDIPEHSIDIKKKKDDEKKEVKK